MKELIMYADLLNAIKSRIRQAQTKATFAVNKELIFLYWDVGRMVCERQVEERWGASVIPRLARDLRNELPEVKGFSERNIKLMTQFHREYPFLMGIGQRAVAQSQPDENTDFIKVPQPVAKLLADDPPEIMRRTVAEYALRDIHKPIGVSDYELTRSLPEALKSALPTIEEIEAELQNELGDEADEP
mgnify:CR=1 FL=1